MSRTPRRTPLLDPAASAMTATSSSKTRAASVAIASNTLLIVLKLVAGILTGSVGIVSDAVHSLMDLVASGISFISVHKADEPADATHPYGHEKLEDLSAGAQAILLLIGAAFVAYEGIHRLIVGGRVESVGLGIIVSGVAACVNAAVSTYLRRQAANTGSAALEATAADLRTDAIVSAGVVLALVLVDVTHVNWLDPAAGLAIGVAISSTGVRILTSAVRRLADETLPTEELDRLERILDAYVGAEMIGYHDLRARHLGTTHQVDFHLQFTDATSLRRAHEISHQIQDAMMAALPGTTVLSHLEPEERVRPDRFAPIPAQTIRTPKVTGNDRPPEAPQQPDPAAEPPAGA